MKIRVRELAQFRPDKMAKIALATTARTQLDLYCLAPGQEQKPHAHQDQDKIYFVLEGRGRVFLDGREETVDAGEAVGAPAGTAPRLGNAGTTPPPAPVGVPPPPPHRA